MVGGPPGAKATGTTGSKLGSGLTRRETQQDTRRGETQRLQDFNQWRSISPGVTRSNYNGEERGNTTGSTQREGNNGKMRNDTFMVGK